MYMHLSRKGYRFYLCLQFFNWNLEVFRQCGIFWSFIFCTTKPKRSKDLTRTHKHFKSLTLYIDMKAINSESGTKQIKIYVT